MPPEVFDPLTPEQIQMFQDWMNQDAALAGELIFSPAKE